MTIRVRRISLLLVVSFANNRHDTWGGGCCQYGLQRGIVKALARKPRQAGDNRSCLAARETCGDELRDCLRGCGHIRWPTFTARPEHERDLTLRRLGELLRKLACPTPDALLMPFRQLRADGPPTRGVPSREPPDARRRPARRLQH